MYGNLSYQTGLSSVKLVGKWSMTDILSSDEDTTNIPYFSIELPVYNEHRGDQALD